MKNNNHCAKKQLKPWIVGLLILAGIVIGTIIFNREKITQSKLWKEQFSPRKTQPAELGWGGGPKSYQEIVNLVKPAVVGISLPGAQPFFQLWPSKEGEGEAPLSGPLFQKQVWQPSGTQPQVWQPSGWGVGVNILTLPCQNCGAIVTRQPGIPWSSVRCPSCGSGMFCPIASVPAGQQQVWQPSGTQPQVWQPSGQPQVWQPSVQAVTGNPRLSVGQEPSVISDRYLLCPNCNIRLDPTPGIPWSNAICPNCKTQMAHVIKETQTVNPMNLTTPLGVRQQTYQYVQQQTYQYAQINPTLPDNPGITQQGFLGIGSGVIVSKKGYILTNYHLVANAKNFTVTVFTPQGPQTFPGRVVANAPERDLSLVKIDPGTLVLSVAPIGNSNNVRVGETVLAFGNPFGLSQTVTSGIVSAIRKNITIEGHQLTELIQTDAPINQGNSGGPLVNLQGEVIGINTAIYSPGQTHTGLGFAVPINHAKEVFGMYIDPEVLSTRRVAMRYLDYKRRQAYPVQIPGGMQEDMPAWLGINIQIMNDILAEQLNLPVDRGLLINEVYRNTPAAEAGLQRGDVIIRVDGKRITDETEVRRILARKKPGDKIKLSILRGRKRMDITVRLAGGAWQQAMRNNPVDLLKGAEIEAGTADIVSLGLTVDNITPEVAFAFNLPENIQGVVISGVEGIALQAGIREGDVIKSVNGKRVNNLLSLFKRLRKADLKTGIEFELYRNGTLVKIVLKEGGEVSPGL